MPTSKRNLLLVSALITVAIAAYVYDRAAGDSASYAAAREANKATATAVDLSRRAQATAREAQAALNEETFKSNRAEVTAKALAAASAAAEAGSRYRDAAEKIGVAIKEARTDEARTYWTMRRNALEKRAETSETAAQAYGIAADESIADLETVLRRMQPLTEQADRTRLESIRLTTEADAYQDTHQDTHRDKF